MTGRAPISGDHGNVSPTTMDAFLGGRLTVEQPQSGAHRAGLDAVLLAAAVPDTSGLTLADLGAGTGVAGLAALVHHPSLTVTLIDKDDEALHLAKRNAARTIEALSQTGSGTEPRVVKADLTLQGAARRAGGLSPQSADIVLTNPPYHDADRSRSSPHPGRARAHMLDDAGLTAWLNTSLWMLRPRGHLILIIRTSRVPLVLRTLEEKLGALVIRPIHARADAPAIRTLIGGVAGSRAPFSIGPGLVLHGEEGSDYRPEIAAILQGTARLALR
ncbi:MAG: methyltransferase [Pseudomonadota bacterium]